MEKTRYFIVKVHSAEPDYGGLYGSMTKSKDYAEDFTMLIELEPEDFYADGSVALDEIPGEIFGSREGKSLYNETCDDIAASWLSYNSEFIEHPENYEVTKEEYENYVDPYEDATDEDYDRWGEFDEEGDDEWGYF